MQGDTMSEREHTGWCRHHGVEWRADSSTAPILGEELAQVELSGPQAIVIDLRDVTFIDSSGFKEFLESKSRAQSNGHRLLMFGANPQARRPAAPLASFAGLPLWQPATLTSDLAREPIREGGNVGNV